MCVKSVKITEIVFFARRTDDAILLRLIVTLFVKIQYCRTAESHCTILGTLIFDGTGVLRVYGIYCKIWEKKVKIDDRSLGSPIKAYMYNDCSFLPSVVL